MRVIGQSNLLDHFVSGDERQPSASLGAAIVSTGVLLPARMRAALSVLRAYCWERFAWAVAKIGFDWWPLAARVDLVFLMALWLLTPWVRGKLDRGRPVSKNSAVLPL